MGDLKCTLVKTVLACSQAVSAFIFCKSLRCLCKPFRCRVSFRYELVHQYELWSISQMRKTKEMEVSRKH
jgi:hypothetical protein